MVHHDNHQSAIKCRSCQVELPQGRKPGLCKSCGREAAAIWRANNPERWREICRNAQRRKNGLPVPEFIPRARQKIVRKTCGLCGKEKELSDFRPRGKGRTRNQCLSCWEPIAVLNQKQRVERWKKAMAARPVTLPAPMKRCRKCGQEKPSTEEFWYFRWKDRGLTVRAPYGYCKPCHYAQSREWKKTNFVHYREISNARNREVRTIVIAHYGGKCACCGEERFELLAIDHVGGGGTQHRKKEKIDSLARWLFRRGMPEGFRILCHGCNQAIGAYGCCPHVKEKNSHSAT